MTEARVCAVEPFRYQATPQPIGEAGASSNQINEQFLEDYLSRLRTAICDDLVGVLADIQTIFDTCCQPVDPISFLELTDTPNSYAGAAGYNVTVKGDLSGLEFTAPSSLTGFLTQRWLFLFLPGNAGAGMQQLGVGTISQSGAASTQTPATTNHLTSFYRTRYAAAAGGISGIRNSVVEVFRGASSPQGGFKLMWRWGTSTSLATQRSFVGIGPGATFSNVDPSTLTNIFGVGYDNGQTTLHLFNNDNGGTATPLDLGANFPKDATSVFQLIISCSPSSSTMEYEVTNLTNGAVASGSIGSNLPVNTTLLAPIGTVSSTAGSGQIEFMSCYLETAL